MVHLRGFGAGRRELAASSASWFESFLDECITQGVVPYQGTIFSWLRGFGLATS